MIFPEHFGENLVILLQTVAELWCIKFCAIFFWATLYISTCLLYAVEILAWNIGIFWLFN